MLFQSTKHRAKLKLYKFLKFYFVWPSLELLFSFFPLIESEISELAKFLKFYFVWPFLELLSSFFLLIESEISELARFLKFYFVGPFLELLSSFFPLIESEISELANRQVDCENKRFSQIKKTSYLLSLPMS